MEVENLIMLLNRFLILTGITACEQAPVRSLFRQQLASWGVQWRVRRQEQVKSAEFAQRDCKYMNQTTEKGQGAFRTGYWEQWPTRVSTTTSFAEVVSAGRDGGRWSSCREYTKTVLCWLNVTAIFVVCQMKFNISLLWPCRLAQLSMDASQPFSFFLFPLQGSQRYIGSFLWEW